MIRFLRRAMRSHPRLRRRFRLLINRLSCELHGHRWKRMYGTPSPEWHRVYCQRCGCLEWLPGVAE